ncbi:hypothetical protein GcM3_200042 [Golovinomyces cichoracearum]|uniref:Uncharacterized protein n=1 Tax=Golovinomyces cichoracearum TaxID=62708 RepID=A0A420HDU4_9PEZI|nr:hypothetical protein GcM3_200042 [Golovinomyces cichoracearum]
MDDLGIIETDEMLIIGEKCSSRKTNQDKTGVETIFEAFKETGQNKNSHKIFVDEREQKFLKASFTIDQFRINQVEQQIDNIQLITRKYLFSLNLRSGYDFLRSFEQFLLMDIIPAKPSLSEQEIDIIKNSILYLPGVTVTTEIKDAQSVISRPFYSNISSICLPSGAESLKIDTLLLVQEEFNSSKTQITYLFPFNEQSNLCQDCQGRDLRALEVCYNVYFPKSELKAYSYQGFILKIIYMYQ